MLVEAYQALVQPITQILHLKDPKLPIHDSGEHLLLYDLGIRGLYSEMEKGASESSLGNGISNYIE